MAKKECVDHLGNVYASVQDMCAFWNIDYKLYKSRIRHGKSLEEILTSPKIDSTRKISDHKGNLFDTQNEMCEYWNVSTKLYYYRIKHGYSLEQALTTPVSHMKDKGCCDHNGQYYSSREAMCENYKISCSLYYKRRRNGMSLEDALVTPVKKGVYDHKKILYESTYDMCKHYCISHKLYIGRIKQGWSIEQALTTPKYSAGEHSSKKCKDHKGNEFHSVREMCRYYNIPVNVYKYRVNNNWTLEKALTEPIMSEGIIGCKKCKDHIGNEYPSIKELCKHYNISEKRLNERIRNGWTLEKALTTPKVSSSIGKKCKDHLGNEFISIEEMCKYHKIPRDRFISRINSGAFSLEEALTLPKHLYIGEYRVAEALKRLNIKFYHDCTIKKVFEDLHIPVNWNEFLDELQRSYTKTGTNWTKQKIAKLRPDFVIHTDENNKIRGVIEFDGAQHQKLVDKFFKTVEDFFRRSDMDFVKQSLWEYLEIPMLRVRDDQINMIDEMVEDFIAFPENYIENHNTYLDNDEYWTELEKEKERLEPLLKKEFLKNLNDSLPKIQLYSDMEREEVYSRLNEESKDGLYLEALEDSEDEKDL